MSRRRIRTEGGVSPPSVHRLRLVQIVEAKNSPPMLAPLWGCANPEKARHMTMANNFFIARVKRLKKSSVSGSVKHQFRLIDTPNADPARRHLNFDFGPQTPEEMYKKVDEIYKKEKIKVDTNKTYLAEMMISFSNGALNEKSAREMFNDAKKYLENKHGKSNVIGGSFQFDEGTPHACFYIVPIAYRETRLVKKSVIAKGVDENGKRNREIKYVEAKGGAFQSYKELFGGNKRNLSLWQTEMHKAIGEKYGLERGIEGSKAHHTTIQDYYKTLHRNEFTPPRMPKRPESSPSLRARFEAFQDPIGERLKGMELAFRRFEKTYEPHRKIVTNSRIQLRKLEEKDATIRALDRERTELKSELLDVKTQLTKTQASLEVAQAEATNWKAKFDGLMQCVRAMPNFEAIKGHFSDFLTLVERTALAAQKRAIGAFAGARQAIAQANNQERAYGASSRPLARPDEPEDDGLGLG